MFRIPILSLTGAGIDVMSCGNFMMFPVVLCFLLFLMAVALDFDDFTFSSRRLYHDFFHYLSFGGGLLTIVAWGVTSSGRLCVGRLIKLPFFMMSFQLDALPSNSFSALLPSILAPLTKYNQYCWLLILLFSNSEVPISSRHFPWG